MRRNLRVGFGLCCWWLIAATAAATTTQYFRSVGLDGNYAIVGSYPLNPEEAKKANSYELIYDNGQLVRINYRKAGWPAIDPVFDVAQIQINRDSGVETRLFFDADGKPMQTDDGVYGERLILTKPPLMPLLGRGNKSEGVPTEIINLDRDGNPTPDKMGVTKYVRAVDKWTGLPDATLFWDGNGNRIFDSLGHWTIRNEYDPKGKKLRIQKANYGPNDQLLNDRDGVAITRFKYDANGNVIEESWFDAQQKPVLKRGRLVHMVRTTYDANGNIVAERFFDATGAPMADAIDGAASIERQYDNRGNLIEKSFRGVDNQYVESPVENYAVARLEYDTANRKTLQATYGADGRLIRDPANGVAITRWSFDSLGRLTSTSFFGVEGEPIEYPIINASTIRYEYLPDAVRTTFLDEEGRPKEHEVLGFASVERPLSGSFWKARFYNEKGRRIGLVRVFLLNPFVKLVTNGPTRVRVNAILGGIGLALGCAVAAVVSIRGLVLAYRRKTYVPTNVERWCVAVGLLVLGAGFILWLSSVQYVLEAIANNDIVGPGPYFGLALFLLVYSVVLIRVMGSIRVFNIERDTVHQWIVDFLKNERIRFRLRRGRYWLSRTSEIQVTYFAFSRHAYIFFKRRAPGHTPTATKLRKVVRARTAGAHCPTVPVFSIVAYTIAAFIFIASTETSVFYLIQLIRGY